MSCPVFHTIHEEGLKGALRTFLIASNMSCLLKAILYLEEWSSVSILKKPPNITSPFINNFILFCL